jgi:hypothetical protein
MIDLSLNFSPLGRTGCSSRERLPLPAVYQFIGDDRVYVLPAVDRFERRRPQAPEIAPQEAPPADGPLVRFLGWLGGLMDGRRG